MNILLINHYAGSHRMGMEYRPFYLAREWAADGHSVTIIAADRSHLRGSGPAVDRDLSSTEEEGVRYRWLRTNDYRGNGAGRIANILSFITKLQFYAGRIAEDDAPEVVICSSTYPLDIYAGARIARKRGARLVFEVHDLWPLTPVLLGGYSPRHPYIRVLQRAEDYACHNAGLVISILPHALDYLAERGLDPAKFVHVPNGVPLEQASANGETLPRGIEETIARERGRGRFLIGFAGGLGTAMDVETLVEASKLLSPAGISFLIAGDGPHAGCLRTRVARSGLDNFQMVGQIRKSLIPEFLGRADALALPLHRSPLYRFGISPNKLFDYMLAAKPILQSSDASNDLVTEAQCGLTLAPEDPAAFADAATQLRALPERERRRLGENGRRFVVEHHDYRQLARRFLSAVASAPR